MNNSINPQEINPQKTNKLPPAYYLGMFGGAAFILILLGIALARSYTTWEWVKVEKFNVAVFLLAVLVFTGNSLSELYAEAVSSSKSWSDLKNKIKEIWEMQGGKLTPFDKFVLIFINLIIFSPIVLFFIVPSIKDELKIEDFSVFMKEGAYYYPILFAFLISKFGFVPFLKYEEPKSSETTPTDKSQQEGQAQEADESSQADKSVNEPEKVAKSDTENKA